MNTPDTIQDFITRSRAICDAAQRGNWLVVRDAKGRVCIESEDSFWIAEMVGGLPLDHEGESSADFIAHARQALPEVLGALEEATNALAHAKLSATTREHSAIYNDALANIAAALEEAKP